MGILVNKYGNKLDQLNDSEKSAFFELDNYPERMQKMNLSDLAHSIASSNSTIIRLFQKLGF